MAYSRGDIAGPGAAYNQKDLPSDLARDDPDPARALRDTPILYPLPNDEAPAG